MRSFLTDVLSSFLTNILSSFPTNVLSSFLICTPGMMNLVELGQDILCHEDTWITNCIVRSHVMNAVQGGWPRMLKELLHMMTTGPLAISTVGVPLLLHGELFVVFADVKLMLSDLDGHRIILEWMGTASHRPCLVCENIWS